MYGLTETGGPAVAFRPDPDVEVLAVNTDDFLIEVLEVNVDRPTPHGEVGELDDHHARHRRPDTLGALSHPQSGPRCGRPRRGADARVAHPGRADDALKIGGVLLYPCAAAEIMVELLPPAAEWRAVVHRAGDDDELVIEVEGSLDLCRDVDRAFRERIGLGLSVEAREPGSLARSLEKTQRVLVASPRPGRDADAAGPARPQGSLP